MRGAGLVWAGPCHVQRNKFTLINKGKRGERDYLYFQVEWMLRYRLETGCTYNGRTSIDHDQRQAQVTRVGGCGKETHVLIYP